MQTFSLPLSLPTSAIRQLTHIWIDIAEQAMAGVVSCRLTHSSLHVVQRIGQVFADLCLQQPHQFRLHECVVVRYIDTDYARVGQRPPKTPLRLGTMRFLHDGYDILPRDHRQPDASKPRIQGTARVAFRQFLGRAPLVRCSATRTQLAHAKFQRKRGARADASNSGPPLHGEKGYCPSMSVVAELLQISCKGRLWPINATCRIHRAQRVGGDPLRALRASSAKAGPLRRRSPRSGS